MRAITIQQPYAWAVFKAGKDVENRHNRKGQDTARKQFIGLTGGRVLVHSSQRYAGADADRLVQNLSPVEVTDPGAPGVHPEWAFGAILGSVEVTGVHTADQCHDPLTRKHCSPWAEPGCAHLQLTTPRLLHRPIDYKGALGVWQVGDPIVVAAIRRDLTR